MGLKPEWRGRGASGGRRDRSPPLASPHQDAVGSVAVTGECSHRGNQDAGFLREPLVGHLPSRRWVRTGHGRPSNGRETRTRRSPETRLLLGHVECGVPAVNNWVVTDH